MEVAGGLPINPTPSGRRNAPQGRKIHNVELLMANPRRRAHWPHLSGPRKR